MHIRLKKEIIQQKLSKIQNIVEKKGIMPVLNHFLLETDTDRGYILATDLETAVKQPLEMEVLSSGKACINARKFYEIVKELEEEIEIQLLDNWILIKSGRTNYKLATLNPDEFPVWPQIGDSTRLNLSRDFLLTAIEKTIYAAGEADARYVLNGLLFHIKDGNDFRVVGTDGHRLAVFKAKLDGIEALEEKKVILSKKSLNELKKFLVDAESVIFNIGKTHVMFEIDGIVFLTRMIEGNYPDYEVVIPKHNDKVAIFDKKLMISSLRRVSVLSRENQNAVKMDFSEDLITLSASDPELGEAKDELTIDYQSSPIQIGFNAKYLMEAFSEISSDRGKITMSEPDRAVYITDADGSEQFKYECIVMPLRL